MAEVTISSKNQIVIPKEARDALGVKAGDKLIVTVSDRKVMTIERPEQHRNALRGMMKGVYPRDYLKRERDSWD